MLWLLTGFINQRDVNPGETAITLGQVVGTNLVSWMKVTLSTAGFLHCWALYPCGRSQETSSSFLHSCLQTRISATLLPPQCCDGWAFRLSGHQRSSDVGRAHVIPHSKRQLSSFEAAFLDARREFSLNAFICGANMENTFVFIIVVDT